MLAVRPVETARVIRTGPPIRDGWPAWLVSPDAYVLDNGILGGQDVAGTRRIARYREVNSELASEWRYVAGKCFGPEERALGDHELAAYQALAGNIFVVNHLRSYVTENGELWLLSEWQPRNLREFLLSGPLSNADAGTILTFLVTGLRELRRAGVAVNDVAAENVLITSSKHPKFADFDRWAAPDELPASNGRRAYQPTGRAATGAERDNHALGVLALEMLREPDWLYELTGRGHWQLPDLTPYLQGLDPAYARAVRNLLGSPYVPVPLSANRALGLAAAALAETATTFVVQTERRPSDASLRQRARDRMARAFGRGVLAEDRSADPKVVRADRLGVRTEDSPADPKVVRADRRGVRTEDSLADPKVTGRSRRNTVGRPTHTTRIPQDFLFAPPPLTAPSADRSAQRGDRPCPSDLDRHDRPATPVSPSSSERPTQMDPASVVWLTERRTRDSRPDTKATRGSAAPAPPPAATPASEDLTPRLERPAESFERLSEKLAREARAAVKATTPAGNHASSGTAPRTPAPGRTARPSTWPPMYALLAPSKRAQDARIRAARARPLAALSTDAKPHERN